MKIGNRKIYRTTVAAAIFSVITFLVLLPWSPTVNTDDTDGNDSQWNVAHADISAWASRVSGGNTECPLPQTSRARCNTSPKVRCERTRTFVTEALRYIRAESSMGARVVKAAQLAIDCEIYFGSCGRSASAVWALAGYEDSRNPAPTETSSGCLFTGLGCGFLPAAKRTDDGDMMGLRRDYVIRGRYCNAPNARRDCLSTNRLARETVKVEIQRSLGTSWPDNWADGLEPGDWLTVYNGNSTPIGSHSVIFLGWEDETAGRAYIFEGNASAWSGEPAGSEKVRLNTMCLKPACGQGAFIPLVKVTSPE